MSSHESPTPIPAEAGDALFVALVQVCETSFFAFVESCEPDRFATLVDRLSPPVERPVEKPSPPPKRRGRGRRSGPVAPEPELADRPQGSDWLMASVSFTGSVVVGTIDVTLPERLARQLVASLLGISQEIELQMVELLEPQVFDGIGEFANMICGTWLTDLGGSQAFDLRPPKVTRLPPGWSPTADSGEKDDRGHRLCVNDLPMRVLVHPSTD